MKRWCSLASVVAVVMLTAEAGAVASGEPDIATRARGAGKVVVATARSISPQWRTNAFGDQVIVSLVELQIEETLKGTPATSAWLAMEGGTLGEVTLHVSSMPTMRAGERAVFFLDATNEGTHVPHLKGMGILKLDGNNNVQGSTLRLDDIRRLTRSAGQ